MNVSKLFSKLGWGGRLGGLGRPTDPIPYRRDARTGTLPNGLRYFILENSVPENRAFLRLVVHAGSLHEEDHEQGIAHFVEHMAFRGTERFPEADLVNYLRSLGMRYGPEINAFVYHDKTVFCMEVPVEANGTSADGNGKTRTIPHKALEIMDDWSRAITFDPGAVDLERLIIAEERRGNLGAWERIRKDWMPALFHGSRFAERMPIGRPETIETATSTLLNDFYRKWYRADNMTLVFVGDFDGAALEASLPDHFRIEKPDAPTPQPVFDLAPPRDGRLETLVLTDPELTGTQVMLYSKRAQKTGGTDLAAYRNGLIDALIFFMMNFRFWDVVLNPETPYMSAATDSSEHYGTSSRFYVMSAVAKSGLAEETLAELLLAKETMMRHGFTKAEIALAGESLVSPTQGLVREQDRQDSGMLAALFIDHYLDAGGLTDFEWELDAIRRLLPGIRAGDINAAVRDYFAANDIQVFVFAPDSEKETLPDDARIRQLVSRRRNARPWMPRAGAVEGRLLQSVPERGGIVSRSVDDETGTTFWDLGNGARVILKPTENMNDEIVLVAMARGGAFCAPLKDSVSVDFAAEMMEVSGLGPWSRPELLRLLAAKQVSLSYWIDTHTRGLGGASTVGDLRTLFEKIHLNFTCPRIERGAVEAMMDSHRTNLSLRGEDPMSVFSDETTRVVTCNHPRCRPLEPADLSGVDVDVAMAFLQKGLNPTDFTFVFTGNLTPELMEPYVETYIASIPPGGEAWNTWTDVGIVRPGKIEKNVYRGMEKQSTVTLVWFADADIDEHLNIAAQVLHEYLNIRLNDEIRDKLGGSYGIVAAVGASPVPTGELSILVQFGCDPQRVRELSDAVFGLLDETAQGTNRAAFDSAVEAMHQVWETSMQNNSYIAQSYANSVVLMDQPVSRIHRRPEYIDAVTPADIRRIAALLLGNGPAKLALFPGR